MTIIAISSTPTPITLFAGTVHAGFPTGGDIHEENKINLNDYLLLNANASFLFRVKGVSMIDVGIYDDDVLIVDRSITPAHNHIVLAIIDEEFTVKRLFKRGQDIRLVAENANFSPIVLVEGQELRIWGVVTYNLHNLLKV